MSKKIRIKFGQDEITADLNESEAAELLYQKLPLKISMGRWGDEYYGDCGIDVALDDDARADMEVGELAVWPQGNALCIFFGPTPASTDEKPRAVSPVNPIGRSEDSVEFLRDLPSSIDVEIEKL